MLYSWHIFSFLLVMCSSMWWYLLYYTGYFSSNSVFQRSAVKLQYIVSFFFLLAFKSALNLVWLQTHKQWYAALSTHVHLVINFTCSDRNVSLVYTDENQVLTVSRSVGPKCCEGATKRRAFKLLNAQAHLTWKRFK